MAAVNESVLLDVEDGVATVTLNRPEALNALDLIMAEGLAGAMARCEDDPAIRAVVLRGTGPAFMAGGDLKTFAALLGEPRGTRRAFFEQLIQQVHQGILAMRRMPKPIVAAVHGPAAGFGVSLVLACDLALAAEEAVFTLAYSLIGTSPDGGSTFHLPRAVGVKRAMEIALLGDRFPAADAARIGLINRAVPAAALAAEVETLARRLAAGPTHAYGRTKALINASFERPIEQQLQAEVESFAACALTRDFAEGVSAFLAKRRPEFHGE
jgi:2-(1,2-epoxy-1,2-dihydrophenyl)acetyl-CoA isomerase